MSYESPEIRDLYRAINVLHSKIDTLTKKVQGMDAGVSIENVKEVVFARYRNIKYDYKYCPIRNKFSHTLKTFNNFEVVLGTSYNSLHEVFVIVYNDIVSEEKWLPTDHFDVKLDRGDSNE